MAIIICKVPIMRGKILNMSLYYMHNGWPNKRVFDSKYRIRVENI